MTEFAADELAAELGLSTVRAGGLIADALDLRHRLPAVLAGLAAGTVEGWRAHLVARGTRELSAAQAAAVEAEVLPQLAQVTTARLHKLVTAAAIAADPHAADQVVDGALRTRCVERGRSAEGVTPLFARMDTGDAIRLDARVDQVADLLIELGDTRLKAELRAVALGLLADPEAVQRLWERVRATAPETPYHRKQRRCRRPRCTCITGPTPMAGRAGRWRASVRSATTRSASWSDTPLSQSSR